MRFRELDGMREDPRLPQMPRLEPRQLWFVEQMPATTLSALDRAAVITANVVIYDRALAGVVADALPLGAYAEPSSANVQASGPAISPRALQFVADGWSVVRLVEAGPRWRERMQQAPRELFPISAGDHALPVRLIARTSAERYTELGTCLYGLSELIDNCDDDSLLTVIFGPIATRNTAQSYPFTANGLAG